MNISKLYYRIVPYHFRPTQIWYYLKGRLWKKYNTVRARYLPYTWTDRIDVLPHIMFEVLSEFIEKECSPGHIEWYGEHGHKIEINGKMKYVRDEMQDLYNWWHDVYNSAYNEIEEDLWSKIEEVCPENTFLPVDYNPHILKWELTFKNDGDEIIYEDLMRQLAKLEQNKEKKLDEMSHRLINIRQYLWT